MSYTLILAAAVVFATLWGLLAATPYRVSDGVLENLPSVARGQDLLTLATVPFLVWAAARAHHGSLKAHLLWLGLLLYYAYTYVMYAFMPFNDAFLSYVAIMGLASYGLLDGLLRIDVHTVAPAFDRAPRRAIAWYLIAVAVLFIGMWLAMIVPAFGGGLPAGRFTYDIASSVHILDLAFVLPLLLATGVLLLRQHPAGPVLAGVLLSMKLVLALAMLSMSFAFIAEPNWGEVVLWALIGVVSVAWIVVGARGMRQMPEAWLRSSLWCEGPSAR